MAVSIIEQGWHFFSSYPPHSLELMNNMAPAPQRLVHNENYAAIEHQGHCGSGFLKWAEKSSTEWANTARWPMNSRNSLTNHISRDKLKCQWPLYVASHFLCCSAISLTAEPAAYSCLQNRLRRLRGQRYSYSIPEQMLVSEYWLYQTSRRLFQQLT